MVDDGSTRTLADVIDDLAIDDHRIRVIRQPNRGVSSARNRGLAVAKGHFLGFLDADDYLSQDFVASALNTIIATGADIVFGKMLVLSANLCVKWRTIDAEDDAVVVLGVREVEGAVAAVFSASPRSDRDFPAITFPNVVGALYRASAVRDARFPVGVKHGEDRVFNSLALGRAPRVAVVNSIWYSYDRTHESGVTQGFSAARIPELASTVDAFAQAGGLNRSSAEPATTSRIAGGAAIGILNYVKLAVLASARQRGLSAVPILGDLLRSPSTQNAMRHLPKVRLSDRVVAALTRGRCSRLLVLSAKAASAGRLVVTRGR